MKKIWVLLILLCLVGVGIFFLLKQKHEPVVIKTTKPTPTSPINPTPVIPKVNNYEVPILMYHYIRVADPADTLGVALSVTPQNFDLQMKWLKDNNFSSIHLADLADPKKQAISKVYTNQKKPVVVTFDDGYDDAYTAAFPVLKKYKLSGTFFIIRAFVGRSEYATQAQIDEMAASGMEIGSHTLNHLDLSKIGSLLAKDQIVDSKQGAEVFCYPSGKYTATTVQLVKDAGYAAAVTTKGGVANQDSSLFELPRLRIENISLDNFAKKLTLNN